MWCTCKSCPIVFTLKLIELRKRHTPFILNSQLAPRVGIGIGFLERADKTQKTLISNRKTDPARSMMMNRMEITLMASAASIGAHTCTSYTYVAPGKQQQRQKLLQGLQEKVLDLPFYSCFNFLFFTIESRFSCKQSTYQHCNIQYNYVIYCSNTNFLIYNSAFFIIFL